MFTDLSVAIGTIASGKDPGVTAATQDKAGYDAKFVTATSNPQYLRLLNVREFPAIGAQPNIVNVPVYGQKQAQTVGGQSDPPSLEVTINYVATLWAAGTTAPTFASGEMTNPGSVLANMVGDGISRPWRFLLLPTPPKTVANGGTVTTSATQGVYDSNAGGVGTVANTYFYFMGKIESMLVTPSLTDATTATLAFSVQSDFLGPYTT
jgi:hypothetical protein